MEKFILSNKNVIILIYFIIILNILKSEVRSPKKPPFFPIAIGIPQGGKDLFLPPWGKARMGVIAALYSCITAPRLLISSKNPGYDFATQWESLIWTFPLAPRAATSVAIAIR